MKRVLIVAAALLMALVAKGQSDPWALIGEGDRVPDFEVEMMDGTTISSASLEGRVVWITLWASWCPSCRKELKRLASSEEFAALMENERFLFLPIAREENIATVKAWLKEKGYGFVAGADPTRSIYALFAEQDIPRNVIVGPDGVVIHHSSAYSSKELKALMEKVKKMLN